MEDIGPDHMTLLGEPLNEIAHNIIRPIKSETAVSTHMGLGLYRDRLLHFGGMLRTEVEDGTWMLYARVPLTHQT